MAKKTTGIFDTREKLEAKIISLSKNTHYKIKSIAAMCAISSTTAQKIVNVNHEKSRAKHLNTQAN
ncbi:hypothetical protein [Methylomonas sp. AM2-LC]|uniref:hypothetical protein n=1 Tax=Methylomonas sp. AM2-LC TaxID=3153301 RepID=UPI003266CA9F